MHNPIKNRQAATQRTAGTAYASKLISRGTFHRLTDGTVSRIDMVQAKRLVNELRAKNDYAVEQHGGDSKQASRSYRALATARRLEEAIKKQYAAQGYPESILEGGADLVRGDWSTP